jgi:hypothetical protein
MPATATAAVGAVADARQPRADTYAKPEVNAIAVLPSQLVRAMAPKPEKAIVYQATSLLFYAKKTGFAATT